MTKIQCFARNITAPQLLEYVVTLPFETKWVPNFLADTVAPLIDENTREVVFVQMGPQGTFADSLCAKGVKIWILNTEQMSRVATHQSHLLNMEQMSCAAPLSPRQRGEEVFFPFYEWIFAFLQRLPKHSIGIMDYSASNIRIWKSLFPDTQTTLMPFLPSLPSSDTWFANSAGDDTDEKDNILKPVVFIGDDSSTHRKNILTELNDVVHIMTNVFGEDRDLQLSQFPILLNVHFGATYNIFEEIRILPAILRKQIVVSEESLLDPKHPLAPFVIRVPYERLAKAVRSAIQHQQQLWKKLYKKNPKWDSLLEDLQTFARDINGQT